MQFGRSLSLLVAVTACGGGETSRPDAASDGFDRTALLTHFANDVLLPMQETFAARAAEMPSAIAAHCDALDAGEPGTTLADARAAVEAAIDAWQHADAVLVGPAAMDQKTLRSLIYSWPNLSACEVDRDVVERWNDPASYDVSRVLPNARSLTAIEFLLYPPGTNHNCVTSPPGWDALGANLPRARCRLAHAIAVDVAAQGATLEAAWRADGGNYVGELANAGKSGSSIPSAQAGINLVSDGIFYIDKMVKDMKLGEAAGISVNACDAVQEPCLREVELRYADRATIAIRANLAAVRQVFTGDAPAGEGPGFDDFLITLGHQELADRMLANLDDAIAKADALPDSFLTALQSNYSDVVATHAAVKAFTDDLKSQFLTVLALEIPDDVAADND